MNSRFSLRILVATIIPIFATASMMAAGAPPALKTEHFDRDPGWEGHNNRVTSKKPVQVKQDFGFSATNHAGKAAGEMGGTIQRSTKPASYAAALAPAKTLDDKLTASGTFAITDCHSGAGIFFGFFNSQQPGGSGRPIGSLGMDFDFEKQWRAHRGSAHQRRQQIVRHVPHTISAGEIPPDADQEGRHEAINGRSTTTRSGGANGRFTFTLTQRHTHRRRTTASCRSFTRKEAQARFPNTTNFHRGSSGGTAKGECDFRPLRRVQCDEVGRNGGHLFRRSEV